MNLIQKKPPASELLVIIFIAVAVLVLGAGHLFFTSQRKALQDEKLKELSAINDLKIRQITQWRLERLGGGEFLSDNIFMINKVAEFLKNPDGSTVREDLLKTLESLVKNYDYRSVLLIDTSGIVRLAYPAQDSRIGDHIKNLVPGIIKNRKTELTDLHRAESVSYVHLDLLIPLIISRQHDTSVTGVLALRIDPDKILFPLIQSWPVASKSSESLLIRKDGDEIVYLNKLRHVKNSELLLKKPLSLENLPAAMAIQGISGTVDGEDYRGVTVIAAMKKVPGTQWYMVSKVDRDEVLKAFRSKMILVIIILALILSSTALFISFLIRNQRVKYYREKYESELDRLALIKHFDYILKFANDIILLINTDLIIVEANDKALLTYGYSREEFIGLPLESIRAPETISTMKDQIGRITDNESATFETVHKRRDGSEFPVEISSRLVKIEGSEYYQSIGRDITDRKIAEETLRESEEKFRKIFEESPFPMVMTAKDYIILKANRAFCDMTGYQEDELKSLTFRNFTHPDYIGKDELSLLRLVATEIPIYHTEKQYVRKDGTIIWGSTTVSIIRNNGGEAQFFMAMVEDITHRKKTESELIFAKEKAEESDRLKTAFLHNVSHEIRTPMNAILGFSTLLKENDNSAEEQNQYIDIIFQSSNQLLSIINDIVDIANIESGQVKMHFNEINLNSVLMSLNEQFNFSGNELKIPVFLKTGLSDEESNIRTDSTKLIQVLSNLLNNSIKFTKSGRIDFGYKLKEGFIEFFVSDTGIGISADHTDKIFNRFYQVNAAKSRQVGGTGLGLSICKAYVELLGGTIGVESVPETGTTITFTIEYIPV
jgi:PAS domain S-box-containing protein